ncbi:Beta-1,3-galactosyltransferase 5 [Amphibalanus amphitrite]|uniref:Hexosyltransferase n=1 Tax=Amphibalanus amphitrite TaxID=1232801 RepID=A0A6A4X181_AMPAM|nr:Beta-1,3-galactosyltransferase 5 [Amphibalanus amphitrite]
MTLKLVRTAPARIERRRVPGPPAAVCVPLLCLLAVSSLAVMVTLSRHQEGPAAPPPPPLPAGRSRLYPRNGSLPGLGTFHYVINTDACAAEEDVTMLIVVTSHEGNQRLRSAWRRLLPAEELGRLGARRVFLLGRPSQQEGYTSVNESLVELESSQYGDIVQGDFSESYRNLTLKHLMGLRWAADYCPQARYVVKMDDDIAVDVYQLHDKLTERYAPRDLLLGLIHYDMQPVRDPASKWYVPPTEYPGEFYRPFLSGWMYVVSQDVITRLLTAAESHTNFWIDDVHVTGTLASDAGVRLSSLNAYYTPHATHLECCARTEDLLCDYLVGPAGGDEALLSDFLSQARGCWRAGCMRRKPEVSVARTCVGTDKYRHRELGQGTAEVVAVSWGAS